MRQSEPRRPHREAGMSLYTLLAAVVVLSTLSATLVMSYTGEGSRGKAGYVLLNSIGEAVLRFHNDTGCYPTRPTGLFNLSDAQSYNSCGYAFADDAWNGPYIRFHKETAAGSLVVSDFGPTAKLDLERSNTYSGTVGTVVISNVPKPAAEKIMDACGGTSASCELDGSGPLRSVSQVYSVQR